MDLVFISIEGPPKIGGISSWIINIKNHTTAKVYIPRKKYFYKYLLVIFKILTLYFTNKLPVFSDFSSQCLAYFFMHPRKRSCFIHHGPGTYKFTQPKTLISRFIFIIKSYLHKQILLSSSKQIFVSNSCVDIIESAHNIKLRNYFVSKNGFPITPVLNASSGPILRSDSILKLVYAGRDHKLKNVDKVYEFGLKLKEFQPCELYLCGVNRKFKSVKGFHVLSLGEMNPQSTLDIISNSDLAIFFSDFPEANPLFLIEAMHFGLGIIVNDNPASIETLSNYPYYLYNKHDQGIDFARFLKYLEVERNTFKRTSQDQVNEINNFILNGN